MNTSLIVDERVTNNHRARLAYIYVRQSTAGQVRHHQESTELQYRLVDRAKQFGWPKERVQVIDDDLGKSGTSSVSRFGFQHLIAEIGLGKAGIVLSLDASRLSRNNSDWHRLLELCTLFGVLIADGERIYDPRTYHDRLLLGLSGIMSEAELHQIQIRLHQGERQKATRGELRLPLPAGLMHGRGGEVILNPDEEVQERIRLVFSKFRQLLSAKAVMRYLRHAELALPVRPLHGPEPHEVVWRAADSARVLNILKNPAYAGAYVYGRRRQAPERRRAPGGRTPTTAIALEEWPICLHEAHPGYINWDEFVANQKRLADNLFRYEAKRPGAPRKGRALLQGIAVCGLCGRRMFLRYSGPNSDHPVYRCTTDHDQEGRPRCQEVRSLSVDAEIERLVLAALAPDQIALAFAALGQLDEEARVLDQQWSLKRERARYEADRARRQYDAVEPENRLVARSLEKVWEEKLRQVELVAQEHEQCRRERQPALTETHRKAILTLGDSLPRAWHATTTTSEERKRMLRLVIKEVILDQNRERGFVWFQINWQTGAVTDHRLQRRVQDYAQHADLAGLKQRIAELNSEQKIDAEIACALNNEDYISALGAPFSSGTIYILRKRWGIKTVKINGVADNPIRWPDGSYSVQGAAKILGISPVTVFVWLKKQRLPARQLAKGMPWQIDLSDQLIAEIRNHEPRNSRSQKEAL